MSDDTRFDPVDDELRRRFAQSDAGSGDPDAVLDAMRPRLARARTRRRAAFTGAFATVAVAIVAVSFALAGGGDGSVRTPPATHSTVPRPEPSVPSTAPDGVTTATTDDRGGDPGPTPGAGDESSGGASGSGSSGGSGGGPGTGPATSPTTAPTGTQTQGYASAGGSIVVVLGNGQVSLVSNAPADGFGAEIHDNGPTRVEVRFTNGQVEWRIRVDVVDGQLVPEITQH